MMSQKSTLRSAALIGFYRFWHGWLHFKGAGVLLRIGARFFRSWRIIPCQCRA